VKNLGETGVGIETLLDNWKAAYPDDTDMLVASFRYYLAKSQKQEVVRKDVSRYLGMKPILSLKDSLGKDVWFYQETFFDDELFGNATKSIDRAIALNPDRLDMRFSKISSELAYEKDSPDMACQDLKSLITYNYTEKPTWAYKGVEKVDDEFFCAGVQEYCVALFQRGGQKCFDAFKSISELMLQYRPDEHLFLSNMGSYYLVSAQDPKTALKYYTKVLKQDPNDYTAIKNCVLMARNENNVKMEKKYLAQLINVTESESEKLASQTRLDQLNGKK
jgi:tetratricopeptide (TPR) repeat protein